MGNLLKNVYERHPELIEWMDLFERLGISKKYVSKLHKDFCFIMNSSKHRSIPITVLTEYLGATEEEFGKRIFSVFDAENTGMINFGEFVAALWNFCTLDKDDLSLFTFSLYANAAGEIDGVDISTILKELNGKRSSVSVKHRRQSFDTPAFGDFMTTHSNILFPAYAAQIQLRDKYFGRSFWHELVARRKDLKAMGSLAMLQKQFVKLNMTYKRKQVEPCGVSVKLTGKSTKAKPVPSLSIKEVKNGQKFKIAVASSDETPVVCPSTSTVSTTSVALNTDRTHTERTLTHRSTHRHGIDDVSADSTASTATSHAPPSPVAAHPPDLVLPPVTGPHNRRRGSQCAPIVPPVINPNRRSTAPAKINVY